VHGKPASVRTLHCMRALLGRLGASVPRTLHPTSNPRPPNALQLGEAIAARAALEGDLVEKAGQVAALQARICDLEAEAAEAHAAYEARIAELQGQLQAAAAAADARLKQVCLVGWAAGLSEVHVLVRLCGTFALSASCPAVLCRLPLPPHHPPTPPFPRSSPR
jgi:hypothetical protein